jgi:hypothetical protein
VVTFSPRDLHEQVARVASEGVPAEVPDIPALP